MGGLKDKNRVIFDAEWGKIVREGKEDTTKIILENLLILPSNTILYFFWNAYESVQTTWEMFLKYWTDFCYSGDESNVLIIPDNVYALEFSLHNFHLVDRFAEFSR